MLYAVGEGFEGGQIFTRRHHLSNEEEADGESEHVGGDAVDVQPNQVPLRGQQARIVATRGVIDGDADGHHEQASLNRESSTVA